MTARAALILDFGGVITRTLFETHDITEAALGIPSGTLQWRGPFDPDTDPLWRDMQDDIISERDYWQTRTQEVARLVGREWQSMSDFVRAARGDAAPQEFLRTSAIRAIGIARESGAKLAILSNELDLFYGAEFRNRLPLLREFDLIEDATYSGILKPNALAYDRCARALGLPHECCVFVDDQQRNVHGAVAAGMHAVHLDVCDPAHGFEIALGKLSSLIHQPQEQEHA